MLLGVNNRINDAAITFSGNTFEANFPVANLKDYRLQKTARTEAVTDTTLIFTFSSPTDNMGCVVLANHNLSRRAIVKIYWGTGDINTDLNSGSISPWFYRHGSDPYYLVNTFTKNIFPSDIDKANTNKDNTLVYFLPVEKKVDVVTVVISDDLNADGYFEIGRGFIGNQLEFRESYGGYSPSNEDLSDIDTTPSGIQYAWQRKKLRTLSANGNYQTVGVGFAVLNAHHNGGLTGDVVVAQALPVYETITISAVDRLVVDSNWFSQAFLGRFTALDPMSRSLEFHYGSTLSIKEVA